MAQQFDPFQFGNPGDFLSKVTEFQRANFEAARKIAENNIKAFQELTALRDPQSMIAGQQAILQAAVEKNVQALTEVWQTLGVQLPDLKKR